MDADKNVALITGASSGIGAAIARKLGVFAYPPKKVYSALECMEILSVASQHGIHIYAVNGNWQLDDSIQSKIVAMAFAMAAEIEALLANGSTQIFIAERFGTTEVNLSRWLKKHGLRRKTVTSSQKRV